MHQALWDLFLRSIKLLLSRVSHGDFMINILNGISNSLIISSNSLSKMEDCANNIDDPWFQIYAIREQRCGNQTICDDYILTNKVAQTVNHFVHICADRYNNLLNVSVYHRKLHWGILFHIISVWRLQTKTFIWIKEIGIYLELQAFEFGEAHVRLYALQLQITYGCFS